MEEFKNIPMIVELGIPEIKQVELYMKLRVLLPTEYQDITCPHPGDNIMNKMRAERKERTKKRVKTNKMEGKTVKEKWRQKVLMEKVPMEENNHADRKSADGKN